jgi:hypothetical protein
VVSTVVAVAIGVAVAVATYLVADSMMPDMPAVPDVPVIPAFAQSPTYADSILPGTKESSVSTAGRIGNTISEGVFVARCYGKCKIGGNKIRFNTADDADLRIIVGHCRGSVLGITRWEVNDIEWSELTGTHTKTEYTGTRAQTSDGRFATLASAYRSIAYTAFTFAKNDQQVGFNPNITVVMNGLLCAPLAGGADAFTRKPAVILYDWYLNVEGYTAAQLDLNAFKSLEAVCDAVPTGGTIARYRFDFNIDVDMSINDGKKFIWSSFNGKTIMSQGKIKPIWDSGQMADGSGGLTAKTVSHAFTLDNIIKDSFVWNHIEQPNVVRIHFRDSTKNYKNSSVEIKDEADIAINGEILFEESALFITDAEIARRRCRYKYNRKRYADYACSFTALSGASDIEILDLVTVTHTLPGWTTKQFIVASRGEDELGRMQFALEAYYSGAYDDAQVGTQASYGSDLPNPYVALPVTSVTLAESGFVAGDGSYVPYVTLTYAKPNSPFWLRGQVYTSTDNITYTYYGNTTTGDGFRIDAAKASYEEGDTLYVKVLSENLTGSVQLISAVSAVSVLIGGKSILPSNVTGFSVSQVGDIVLFTMNRPTAGTDADFSHFEIREGASWDASQLIVTCTQTKYPLTGFTSGVKTYRIKAVDTSNNKSLTEATIRISLKVSSIQNIYYDEEEIVRIAEGTAFQVARNYKSSKIIYNIFMQDFLNRIGAGTVSQILRNYVFDYAAGFFINGTEKMNDSGVDTMDDSATERMWTPGYDSGYLETEAIDIGIVTGDLGLDLISSDYDGASYSVQYKTSIDGVTYGAYASFTGDATETFRYVIFKITLTANRGSYPESNIKITGLRVSADISDTLGAGFFIDGTERMDDSATDTMDDSTTERMWTPGYSSGYLETTAIDVGAAVTGSITLDIVSTGYLGTSYSLEYKTSTDNVNYTSYSAFSSGNSATFRYIIFKITLMTDRINFPQSNIKITGLFVSIDLPTIKNSGVDVVVAAGGSTITFDTAYVSAASIRIKINVVSASALIPTHELKTTTNFKAHVFNLAAANVGGTIDWESEGF